MTFKKKPLFFPKNNWRDVDDRFCINIIQRRSNSKYDFCFASLTKLDVTKQNITAAIECDKETTKRSQMGQTTISFGFMYLLNLVFR